MKSSLTFLPESLKEKDSYRFERPLAELFPLWCKKRPKVISILEGTIEKGLRTASLSAAIFTARDKETGHLEQTILERHIWLTKTPRDLSCK